MVCRIFRVNSNGLLLSLNVNTHKTLPFGADICWRYTDIIASCGLCDEHKPRESSFAGLTATVWQLSLDEYDLMLPTPSTSHVDFDRVYEPAEDSFLLLDTLSSTAEISFLTERFGPGLTRLNDDLLGSSPLAVEIGTGSGVVLAFLTAHAETLFGRPDILSLGVDVNPYACKASIETVEQACRHVIAELKDGPTSSSSGLLLTLVNGDLTSSLRPGSVDVLIFNPPYVPTSDVPQMADLATTASVDGKGKEQQGMPDADSDMLALSYAGGVDGMEVMTRLLEQLPSALNAKRGVAYILLCKQNQPEEVVQRIQKWGAEWVVQVVGRSGKQAGWERLQILRICRVV
ncbi:MAG: hypothetical protein Q9166_000160 [cf. Caloplaca sp. 2 TL-2023]